MCGIIAIVRRRTDRQIPVSAELVAALDEALDSVPSATDANVATALQSVATLLSQVDTKLRGEAGVQAMLQDVDLVPQVLATVRQMSDGISLIEERLSTDGETLDNLEETNAALVLVKDGLWAIERDRARTAQTVADLAGADPSAASVAACLSIQQALSGLDRLEVRGRDSAGLHILVRDHGLDTDSAAVRDLLGTRSRDGLFTHGAVRASDGCLSFVYKAAAEIGELGDNTAALRAAIIADELLHMSLVSEDAQATVLGHTRWASVGIISEPNAHPVNSDELTEHPGTQAAASVANYVTATLNGDVDNYSDLIAADKLRIPGEISTDAKVIPTLVSRALTEGFDLDESVRRAVSQFEGSVAIGISSTSAPEDIHVCLRGSGQGVFVGQAEDAFIIASEPYGVVEDAERYLRMDGETPADPDNPVASQGQILRLSGSQAGSETGVTRYSYDGTMLPVGPDEWKTPEVTTRDIDRGDAPHFLLKEISESPVSFTKTLRGRLITTDDGLSVRLPDETITAATKEFLTSGRVKRVLVIGQGTAAVAGQAVSAAFESALASTEISVSYNTATELSGFSLRDDMSDFLIVAISQSGTTTDTNRTVDLARGRGATVLAIVNRRGSDLVDKADGVLYTSDGRDVEMSVASTKAFYAQIAAGFLLAEGVADFIPGTSVDPADRQSLLAALRELPDAMRATINKRDEIAAVAARHFPSRRYWAMVGSGTNLIAARELRIKLSELCYKSIACDVIEDKKHIDLSSEPLIIICAAGLSGSNADDVAKEVAIFRAHKAAPIVIATEGENRFNAALDVISVPEVDQRLAFVLSTVVGHLFGYEAALAIDASAHPLRQARAVIERYIGSEGEWFGRFSDELKPCAVQYFDGLRTGNYNGHLEAGTAVRLASLFRFALGSTRLESYQIEFGKIGTPGVVAEDLAAALTSGIEELTRPVDAIKHQAKTVTVGISRADESLLQSDLIRSILESGCPRDRMSYRTLRTVAALSPAVADVVGFTRYALDGPVDEARISVVDRGGIATGLVSRTDKDPALRGNKHRVSVEREVLVTVGSDGRTVLMVPEVKDGQTTGVTLCHLNLNEGLGAATARSVLQGYRNRYRQLVDVVTESQPSFREDILGDVTTVELLTAPISDVAARWSMSV